MHACIKTHLFTCTCTCTSMHLVHNHLTYMVTLPTLCVCVCVFQICSNELKCVCHLGWAGEDCNSTSPLSYLVVGPTPSATGRALSSPPSLSLSLHVCPSFYPSLSIPPPPPPLPGQIHCFCYLDTSRFLFISQTVPGLFMLSVTWVF